METARHLVVPALQLHLGALLMVLGLVPAHTTRVGDGTVGPADPFGGEDDDEPAMTVDVYGAPARVPSWPWPTRPR